PAANIDRSKPYIEADPACANPGDTITVKGYKFAPNSTGPLNFIPPSEVKLTLGTIQADAQGEFTMTVKLPKRDDTQVQHLRATTRLNVGAPQLSRTALETWDKIIETVFLALLATTFGTLLAVPLSFFAANNLMRDVSSPVTAVALNLLLLPIGFVLGARVAGLARDLTNQATQLIWLNLGGMLLGLGLAYLAVRWAVPPEDLVRPGPGLRTARTLVLLAAAVLALLVLYLFSNSMILVGNALEGVMGGAGFIGRFIADLGDILGMLLTVISALIGAGLAARVAGSIGENITRRLPEAGIKGLNLLLSAAAGALLFILVMMALNWFYQFDNPAVVYYWPGGIGAALGLLVAARLKAKDELPVGKVIYFAARTIFNALRSIEALIMVIVFVVWVGIGPFAGVLALSLHTVAALAKLYSEQVESIMEGPMEAVSATGASRIQTIIYAVIPQIIPPYISFTMYRWDINVRMSTIIGFAGGGGIGFLLYQNINLLNYRAASAQMLAIAIVVASMDYLSAKLREKVI
ncbi:MAG TPA: ABC transporter permease subunit, partial [Anaerolinea sp.]|nr:ABC transporter permease subunit [Anaerolinea sp.]